MSGLRNVSSGPAGIPPTLPVQSGNYEKPLLIL
jgi:hypothetical protein